MLLDLVVAKVKDESGRLTEQSDFQPAIDAALERYSKHRPLEQVEDLDGAGSCDLDLPEGFVTSFSRIVAVEYPIGSVPPELLPAASWMLYRTPTATNLRLLEQVPPAGSSVRVTYTAPRTESGIASGDQDAVACLAASICLRTLAAIYGQTSDPTIQADSVNYGSKADQFRRLADSLEERFNLHLGVDVKGGTPAASAVAAPPRSRERLTH